MLSSLPENTGDINKMQRTHDVSIKVIGNSHINRLVQA
jgi:hypothetical protein